MNSHRAAYHRHLLASLSTASVFAAMPKMTANELARVLSLSYGQLGLKHLSKT